VKEELIELGDCLAERFGTRIRPNVHLAPYTTFGIGGAADLFLPVATEEELVFAINRARQLMVPVTTLGGGSNVLIADTGIQGLVVLDRSSGLTVSGRQINAASGTPTAQLCLTACQAELAGLEFAGNLQGTVGGAICGNAGAYGNAIGSRLVSARVLLDDGTVQEVAADFFNFDYRESCLQEGTHLLLAATFELTDGQREKIMTAMLTDRELRLTRHPWGFGSGGSYFRNLPPAVPGARRQAAGELLDQAGAKGLTVGGAEVFTGHANFIINRAGATAADVRQLAQKMRTLVADKFSLELTEEVTYLGRG